MAEILAAEKCRFDALALGEVMMRIDPGDTPTARAREGRIYHGGGETNVAEGLSACFGLRAGVITALVDDGIGRNIVFQMQEAGLDTSNVVWFSNDGSGKHATDAKGTLHNGINFTWKGKGVLPAVTEYYRAHTPIRELKPKDVDWEGIFSKGVRYFNTGGIYSTISPVSGETALAALKAAGKHGTFRAFDLNYRSKVEPDQTRAQKVNKAIVHEVEFLVGNQADFGDALGYATKKVSKEESMEVWLEVYMEMLRKVAQDYPNLKYIGTQLRGALSADRINWSAVIYDTNSGEMHQATTRENIEIADRVGGGDSFLSGCSAALLDGHGPDVAVEWGAAHGICVQATPGDTTMVTKKQVIAEVKRAQAGGGVTALR